MPCFKRWSGLPKLLQTVSYCFAQHNSVVHISVSNFPSKCLHTHTKKTQTNRAMAQPGLKYFFLPFCPFPARSVFRVQQHLLAAAPPLLSGKGSEGGNFCFPPFHSISVGLCNKGNQLGSGIATNAAQLYLPLWKWELPPELQKDLAMWGA